MQPAQLRSQRRRTRHPQLRARAEFLPRLSPTQALAPAWSSTPKAATWSSRRSTPCSSSATNPAANASHAASARKRWPAWASICWRKEISKDKWDNELLPILKDLTEVLSLTSICGLGRSVPVPLRTVIDFFPEDLAMFLGTGKSGAAGAEARLKLADKCVAWA